MLIKINNKIKFQTIENTISRIYIKINKKWYCIKISYNENNLLKFLLSCL